MLLIMTRLFKFEDNIVLIIMKSVILVKVET